MDRSTCCDDSALYEWTYGNSVQGPVPVGKGHSDDTKGRTGACRTRGKGQRTESWNSRESYAQNEGER